MCVLQGVLCRTLQGHGHWVNTLALSTDYAIRTGAYDPSKAQIVPKPVTGNLDELKQKALERYNEAKVTVHFLSLLYYIF